MATEKPKGTGEHALGTAAVSSEATKVLHQEIQFLSEFHREWKPVIDTLGTLSAGVTPEQASMVAALCNLCWQAQVDGKVGKGVLVAPTPDGTTHKLTAEEVAKSWGIPRGRGTLQGLIQAYGPVRIVAQREGPGWEERTKAEFRALHPEALKLSKSGVTANALKKAAQADIRYSPIFEGMASKRKGDRSDSVVSGLQRRFARIGLSITQIAEASVSGKLNGTDFSLDKSDIPFLNMKLGHVQTIQDALSAALERSKACHEGRSTLNALSAMEPLLKALEKKERSTKRKKQGSPEGSAEAEIAIYKEQAARLASASSEPVLVGA